MAFHELEGAVEDAAPGRKINSKEQTGLIDKVADVICSVWFWACTKMLLEIGMGIQGVEALCLIFFLPS